MVGKRQLRTRSNEQNINEGVSGENYGSSAKRQARQPQNSRKLVTKTSDLLNTASDPDDDDFMVTPLGAVDKNKVSRKAKKRTDRTLKKSEMALKNSERTLKKSEDTKEQDDVDDSQMYKSKGNGSDCVSLNQECAKKPGTKDPFLEDLLRFGLKERLEKPPVTQNRSPWKTSQNLVHVFQQFSLGRKCRVELQKAVKSPIIDLTKNFELYRTSSPFDRRVTAMEWHPTRPSILAVGSKGGDIILWDTESVNKDKFVQGIGAAGSCQAMKFWPWDTDKIVSASINGTVTLHDFETKSGTVLADTMNCYDHWYCSVDVNPERYLVAAGRNGGILHLMSTEGRKVFEFRLHKNKVTHVEFSPREEWLLCTASTDQTVQMWDVRFMKDRKSALHVLHHEKPVNSAYFSYTDGCRLLTTDQNKEMRVYRAPYWHLETTIEHPHRFFQHITPFKATWHPLEDLIVCGRYPDKNTAGSTGSELRTIDIFDTDTGAVVSQLYSQGTDGLCPLNKFNTQGDSLASGMGFHILLWNKKQEIARKQSLLKDGMMSSMMPSGSRNLVSGSGISDHRSRPRPRPQKKKKIEDDDDDDDDDDLKKKTKSKVKTESVKMKNPAKKKK